MDEVNDLWYPLVKQGWTGVSYNLNRDAGGDYIYLLYKTENSPDDLYSSSHITDFYIKQGKSYTPPFRRGFFVPCQIICNFGEE